MQSFKTLRNTQETLLSLGKKNKGSICLNKSLIYCTTRQAGKMTQIKHTHNEEERDISSRGEVSLCWSCWSTETLWWCSDGAERSFFSHRWSLVEFRQQKVSLRSVGYSQNEHQQLIWVAAGDVGHESDDEEWRSCSLNASPKQICVVAQRIRARSGLRTVRTAATSAGWVHTAVSSTDRIRPWISISIIRPRSSSELINTDSNTGNS